MSKWKPNKHEEALIKVIEEAKRYCKGELELNYQDHYKDKHLIGWYAMDYKEDLGGAFSIEANGYDKKPLISDVTIKKYNVNVIKCFAKCNVFVCG